MKTIFVVITCVITLLQGIITPISAAEESFQFSPGANLFAYPIDPGSAYSAADLLADLNDQAEVSSIQRYNSEAGLFETCVWKNNGSAGADFSIQANEGYIVHTSESFVYRVSGDRVCPQVTLRSGLNTAAFPCVASGYDAHQMLQNLGSAVTGIKQQDPADNSVLTATRVNDVIAGDNFSIEHGHSYLVYMDSESSWYPSVLPPPPGNATGYGGDQLAILVWTPPVGDILGYNVYRADSSGGTYEKLNTNLLQVTEYTDQGLTNGTPGYYVISAVDQYSRETGFSSEVAVTPAYTGPTVIVADITAHTTWTLAGSPYSISDSLTVSSGTTLTLEPGVVVEFHTGRFDIDGKLIAKGTAEHNIVFRADDDSWTGLRFDGSGTIGSILEYCHIEDGSTPVAVEYSDIEISHCSIDGTSSYGLYYNWSAGHIHHTIISGSYSTMRGIYLTNSSPLVEYNSISSFGTGIYMYADSSPQIFYNTISEFSGFGLDLSGSSSAQPYPTVTDNIIKTSRGGSSTYLLRASNYYNNPAAGVHRSVNVKHNYWGTDDPGSISATISQWTGGTSGHPYVDFSDFLDRPDGDIVQGHFISAGPLPAGELSWTLEQGPYIVLGHALVPTGQELIIALGTEVQFAGGIPVYGYDNNVTSSLQVAGKLTAVGTAGSPIHFLSSNISPEKGDWAGIVFLENADNTSRVSYSRIEHAFDGVHCQSGASPAIDHNEIIAGSGSRYGYSWSFGIRLEGGSLSAVSENLISGYDQSDCGGIYILDSSPTVTGNSIEGNWQGLYIKGTSSQTIPVTPVITGNSILNSIARSIYLYGTNNDATNPQPVISNNTIFAPSISSGAFYTLAYGTGSTIEINARNNWWGTVDPAVIASYVYDKNDNSSSPLVDYRFFLNSENGQPGIGNQVLGNLEAGATLNWPIAGSPYQVMGDLDIPVGTTLSIDAGVEIWMSSGGTVNVDGVMIVDGTEGNPVTFTAGSMTELPADWEGIRLIGVSNDSSSLSYCYIENAKQPIYIEDCSPAISYCEITASVATSYTIRLLRSNAHIQHCTITNDSDNTLSNRGLYLDESSPLVEYNLISGMWDAIYLYKDSNPQILNNTLLDFSYTGIVLYGSGGNPDPVINNNTLQTSRGGYTTWLIRTSYYENDPLNGVIQSINARNNYWGTSNPQMINGAIDQWSGENTDPIIDFSGFLDGPGGTAVSGHFIPPGLLTELTWQPASGPYIVLGHTFVANGQELTIAAGTEIRFLGGSESVLNTTRDVRSSLRIYGKLTASGTSESIIYFYSNHSEPTEGDWSGIFFYDNADDTSIISYSKIEHARNSIYCAGAAPEVSNNTILSGPGSAYSSYVYGIYLESGSDAVISDNLISGFSYSGNDGIYILDSSPTVSNNIIAENYYGIYLKNGSPAISGNIIDHNTYGIRIAADSNTAVASTPAITSNAIVDSTSYSVYIDGYSSGDNSTSPLPVFTNNSFVTQFSPADSFYTTSYSSSNTVTINAKSNWWGASTESEINDIIRDYVPVTLTGAPTVDFEPFLTESPTPLLYHPSLSLEWISPNSGGNQEEVIISWQGGADVSTWTVTVKDASGVAVRTEVVGSLLEWIWDGKYDDSDTVVTNGQYTITVSGSNGNGTIEREAGSVTVDTVPFATVQIDLPTDAQAPLQNIFDVVVTVLDDNISNYTLEIGRGVSPASWGQLQTGSVNIDNAPLYTLESNTIDTDSIPSLPTVGELTDGPYTLRLTATDLAGNTTAVKRSISLENVFITDISVTELVADLTIGQSAAVEYTIDKTADVVLRIYTETEGDIGQLVRVFSQSSLAAGTHSFSWDGRDDSAEYVDIGGYVFVLSATTGSELIDQFIPDPTLNVPVSWSPDSTFNTSTNDWFTADCTMGNAPGHYRVRITPSGETEFNVYTKYYAAHESFLFTWDGRRPDGTLVDINTAFWIYDTWSNANLFIVRSSSAPEVTGQAPNVNVKSDPFLINFCYGEQTSLLYNLDREAEITITLFPVDEDASSPDAVVLVDQETQSAGDHTVTWDATDVTDIRHILFSREGLYVFVIEATTDGITSNSRGVINLYK